MGNSRSSNDSKKDPIIHKSSLNQTEILKAVGGSVWEFQSNHDPWAIDELPKWTKYSTEQMQIIEKAFQEKKETVEIGDYIINFESLLQMHKDQNWKVRPVRRTEMSQRAGHFCSELITPRTFGRITYTGDPTIVEKWLNKRKFNFKIDKQGNNITDAKDMPQLREVVALAIKGILEEGEKDNWSCFAEAIAKRLENSISHNSRSIFRECVYVYTEENKKGASLYAVANKALREIDYSKVETLGPYCYLLNFALKVLSDGNAEFFSSGKVYRGLGLEENMLGMYKTVWKRGLQISFHSFVSTSKSEDVATMFSFLQANQKRVLLVIENLGGAYIEALSSHPSEQEILLPASRGFQITHIDETNSDMITIHLKMLNTRLDSLHIDGEFESGILVSHSSFTELPPSLSQWGKCKELYFETDDHGQNITPKNKSFQLKQFVKLAAEGIRKVGETQENEEEREKGRKMVDMIVDTMEKAPEDIFKVLLKIHTMESFLYKQVTMSLRSEDPEKLTDLGSYCYLLQSYLIALNERVTISLRSRKAEKSITLFRPVEYPHYLVNLFMELHAKGLHFAWSSFFSTTCRREIAESFATSSRRSQEKKVLLFLISVPESMATAFDVSIVSDYPQEREVLLPPNVSFKITDIDTFENLLAIKLEFIDYVIG